MFASARSRVILATKKLASPTAAGISLSHLLWRPAALEALQRGQERYYSQTCIVLKDDEKKKKDYYEGIPPVPELPDIQTMNREEGITDEEIEALFDEAIAEHEREQAARFVPNWKPGMRKRPLVVSRNLEDFEYEMNPDLPPRWTLLDKRSGVLALKLGMMPFFDEWGEKHPTTVLYVDENYVVGHKTEEKHGYSAVQIAAGRRKRKNVRPSVLGQYKDFLQEEENPPYLLREFRLSEDKWLIPIGTQMHARHFVPGQNVDVAGISKGKGFQGGMKRWNFKGMPATHGVSKSHRAIGSTGQCQNPGRVFKGKKMPGRMGGERKTLQNLRVLKIDRGRNLIYVKGGVPGNKGEWVEVRDSVKKPLWKTNKVAPNEDGSIPDRPPLPTFEFDDRVDGSQEEGHEEVMPLPVTDPMLYEDQAVG